MFGIVEARKIYNGNPEDPYVVLPGNERIEVRFDEDGSIIGAYLTEDQIKFRWLSQELQDKILNTRRVDELPRKEELTSFRATPKLEGPRQAPRIRLRAEDAFGQANGRR